jgi:hypothetical protein
MKATGLDIRILDRCDVGTIDPVAWDFLADVSSPPNPFYERWSLVPALKHLDKGKRVQLVTVYRAGSLVCLFPVRLHGWAGAFRALTIWRFPDCGATDVLCESGVSFEVVLRDIMTRLRAPVAVSTKHRPEGFDVARHLGFCRILRTRKAVTRVTTWDAYQAGLSGKHRRENRRVISRALDKEGMRYVTSDVDLISSWYPRYLDVERESWKFSAGNTLSSNAGIFKYFEEAIQYGEEGGKIEFRALLKGDEVAAMSFRFKAQHNAYEIKTTYSNKFKHLYPGVVLELLNIRDLLGDRFVLADSCSNNNPVVQRIWPDEISICRTIVFDDSLPGDIAKFIYSRYRTLKKSSCAMSLA